MVGVLDTNDHFALKSAANLLNQAGIVYDVVLIADVPDNLKVTNPKWWMLCPSRILVAAEDEGEARALVERFQWPFENSEVADTSERDRLSGSYAAESRWRVMTLPRAAVILGVPLAAALLIEAFQYSGVISKTTIQSHIFMKCFSVGLFFIAVGVIVDAVRM
jgi:hypothetical protein